jgi:hypothetical protein
MPESCPFISPLRINVLKTLSSSELHEEIEIIEHSRRKMNVFENNFKVM